MKKINPLYYIFFLFLIPLFFIWENLHNELSGRSNPPKFAIVDISDSYFENILMYKVDIQNLESIETLSATTDLSFNLGTGLILSVAITIFFVRRFVYNFVNSIFLITIVTLGNLFLLFQIDDFPDEAYAWASKVDNFISSGHLGIQLYNGEFGESTVGTLHFLLAVIPRILGLTIEQSLVIPLLIALTISANLLFNLIKAKTNSIKLAVFISVAFYLNPVLGFNFAFAFDNVLAFSILITWIYLELNSSTKNKFGFRCFAIAIFPLVRLDYILVSLGIILLHIFENNLRDFQSLKIDYVKNKNNYLRIMFFFLIWIFYKAWAFGEIVPAMASYKGFHYSPYLWSKGVEYLYNAFYSREVLFVFFGLIFSICLLFFSKKNDPFFAEKQLNTWHLIVLNSSFLVLSMFATIFAGGDYFGPLLLRYQFPFVLVILLLLLLEFHRFVFGENKNLHFLNYTLLGSSFVLFLFLTIIVFYRPSNLEFVKKDIVSVEMGRTTCEAAAAYAIKNQFPLLETVGTSEINGFAYHAELKLADMIGLVDTQLENDGTIGDALKKFRIIPTQKQISSTDVVWLWPSSECSPDPVWFSDKGEPNDSAEYQASRLKDLILGYNGVVRIPDFKIYMNQGFKPAVLYYSYKVSGTNYFGQAYFFLKI